MPATRQSGTSITHPVRAGSRRGANGGTTGPGIRLQIPRWFTRFDSASALSLRSL